MLDLDVGRRVILRELDGLITRLDEASEADWERPVRCEGWTVLELAIHCTSAPRAGAESLRRMHSGVTEQPDPPVSPAPMRSEVIATLRLGRNELAAALNLLTPESLDAMAPLFFTSIPGVFAIQLLAVELGMHRNDLEWALGNREALPDEVIDAALTLVPVMLPGFAAGASETPARPVGYRFASPNQALELVFTDGEWRAGGDASLPLCVIEGDDSSITLFVLGRIPSDHPSLTVSGETELADRFKRYFPGPVNEAADRTMAVERVT